MPPFVPRADRCRYVFRVVPNGGLPFETHFSTSETFGFDAEGSTHGSKIRLSNGGRSVTSSGGTAAAVGDLGFSKGRVTFAMIVEVSVVVVVVLTLGR